METTTGIGKRIYQLRIERELTLDMLATDMNQKYNPEKPINKSMLSRWENEANEPSLENARLLAMYYDVSLDYLIGLTDVRTPSRLQAYARKIAEGKKNEL